LEEHDPADRFVDQFTARLFRTESHPDPFTRESEPGDVAGLASRREVCRFG
jgi:hypothetical protein